ncbi:amino acid ABC transporter permease [Microbacterium suwonense]|uniref:Amino-acid ABC transporter permease protein YckA n=1 Tax=Microbacterium suwonense TaxID=683047 RepID=A0ABN6X0H4_9MICO|nr:amino acid ABC transporter permease [Microbacterium suwonense]BDZ38167.1 putative amino-acid ABC transporter permease protein YckA [Microbacterium suwonense]
MNTITVFWDDLIRLLPGLWGSLQLAGVSLAVGLPLGFLAGLALNSAPNPLRWVTNVLVQVFRGFPALLTLYIVYFGIADVLPISRFSAVVIAFSVTAAAYLAEIFRSTIASAPRGQMEAASALGLNWAQRIAYVLLPHVTLIALVPVIGICIIVFQGTALAIAIGSTELLGTAMGYGTLHLDVMTQLLVASVLFVAVTAVLSGGEWLAQRRSDRILGKPARVPHRYRHLRASTNAPSRTRPDA